MVRLGLGVAHKLLAIVGFAFYIQWHYDNWKYTVANGALKALETVFELDKRR